MPTTLSPVQIIDLIQNDVDFAINFIIDNNPSGVESNISGFSIPLPENPSNLQLKEVIDDLLNDSENQQAPEQINDILGVPYIDSSDNYTGNLEGELTDLGVENGTIEIGGANQNMGSIWVTAVAGVLGAVGNVWSGILNNKALGLQQQMLDDAQQHEIDMVEKTKVFGIPQTIILGVLALFGLILVLLYMGRKK